MATRRLGGIATSSSAPDNGGDHSGGGGSGGYVDDVFSTYLYKGTSAPQDIVNGIDLTDKGGLIWIKTRTRAEAHALVDTERGGDFVLASNETSQQRPRAGWFDFQDYGFSINSVDMEVNNHTTDYASWTFAKQEGFFDVVTYTGDDVAGREIPHNLGSEPGMIIVKRLTGSENWQVFHKDLSNPLTKCLALNSDAAESNQSSSPQFPAMPTDTVFSVGDDTSVNSGGALGGAAQDYVAYLFADDAPMFGPNGDESIIKCGSVGPAGTVDVDLGWEPQFLLWKQTNAANDWYITDTMRGFTSTSNAVTLRPSQSAAENASNGQQITSTGFTFNTRGNEFIYMAIRRPNKPAEEFEPDELFAVESADGTVLPQFKTGWPVDFTLTRTISGADDTDANARLIQGSYLKTNSDVLADTSGAGFFDYSNGWRESGAVSSTLLSWMFRRAPGFFDVVTYAGDGVAGRQLPHNLGVKPDMMWVKRTSDAFDWQAAYCKKDMTYDGDLKWLLKLNTDAAWGFSNVFNAENPTDSYIPLNSSPATNFSGSDYIAFLWASVPGICDIGIFKNSGAGTEVEVDCGFTNGARFVLIKRTDAAGHWMFFDTLRGIAIGGSPMIQLDLAKAQRIDPAFEPFYKGFKVKAVEADAGVPDAEFIYIAIA